MKLTTRIQFSINGWNVTPMSWNLLFCMTLIVMGMDDVTFEKKISTHVIGDIDNTWWWMKSRTQMKLCDHMNYMHEVWQPT
jgi:hypothetical protein